MFKRSPSRRNHPVRVVFKDFRYFYDGADWEVYIENKTLEGPGIVEIRAPSGTGKSMVLGFVSGTDQSDYGGSLTVLGTEWRDIARRLGRDRVLGRHRRSIALIPAEPTLVGTRTVRETLERDLKGARVRKQERDRRIKEVLELLDITHQADQRLSTISAGESQRVRIAVALARKAQLIIADEPIAHLDAKLVPVVIDALVDQSKHALVLMVHHLPPDAKDLLEGRRKELVLLAQYRRTRLAQPLVVDQTRHDRRVTTVLATILMMLVLSAALFIWRQSQNTDTLTTSLASHDAAADTVTHNAPPPLSDGQVALIEPTATTSSDSAILEPPTPTATMEPPTERPEPTMTPIVFMPTETTEPVSATELPYPTSPAIEPIGPEQAEPDVTTETVDLPPTEIVLAPDTEVSTASDAPTVDLMSILPSQSDIPDGLVTLERRSRTLDEIVTKYANPDMANENFTSWGWKANVICSFGLPEGVIAQSGILNGVYVSIHEFDSPASAQAALDFSLTEQQVGQPLNEVYVGQFGDYTRGLSGLLDYGYETTILAQQGNLLVRVSAAELDGDPTSKARAIMSAILAKR